MGQFGAFLGRRARLAMAVVTGASLGLLPAGPPAPAQPALTLRWGPLQPPRRDARPSAG
jgi:hypothetical protein